MQSGELVERSWDDYSWSWYWIYHNMSSSSAESLCAGPVTAFASLPSRQTVFAMTCSGILLSRRLRPLSEVLQVNLTQSAQVVSDLVWYWAPVPVGDNIRLASISGMVYVSDMLVVATTDNMLLEYWESEELPYTSGSRLISVLEPAESLHQRQSTAGTTELAFDNQWTIRPSSAYELSSRKFVFVLV
jgi:hypothetical protein